MDVLAGDLDQAVRRSTERRSSCSACSARSRTRPRSGCGWPTCCSGRAIIDGAQARDRARAAPQRRPATVSRCSATEQRVDVRQHHDRRHRAPARRCGPGAAAARRGARACSIGCRAPHPAQGHLLAIALAGGGQDRSGRRRARPRGDPAGRGLPGRARHPRHADRGQRRRRGGHAGGARAGDSSTRPRSWGRLRRCAAADDRTALDIATLQAELTERLEPGAIGRAYARGPTADLARERRARPARPGAADR